MSRQLPYKHDLLLQASRQLEQSSEASDKLVEKATKPLFLAPGTVGNVKSTCASCVNPSMNSSTKLMSWCIRILEYGLIGLEGA